MFKLIQYSTRRSDKGHPIKVNGCIPVFSSKELAATYLKAMDGRGISARHTFLAPISRITAKHKLDPQAI